VDLLKQKIHIVVFHPNEKKKHRFIGVHRLEEESNQSIQITNPNAKNSPFSPVFITPDNAVLIL
jgi:hypothetical protein